MSLSMFYPDFTNVVVGASSSTDNTITVPAATPMTLSTPNNAGGYWYLSVVGASVAINYNATAVYGTNAPVGVTQGLNVLPIRLPPGTVIHFITATGTGYVSIIKANIAQ